MTAGKTVTPLNPADMKGLSRRQFMERCLATGMTVAAASALYQTEVVAQTPKKGGTYRVGVHDGNTTDSWDPGTTEGVYMIQMSHCARSFLTEITETNGLGGDMATSWEASADATEWRFELAKDAEFHNGKSFTAEDAVASLNFHRGEESKSAAKSLFSDVVDIKADGKHAIVIKTSAGNADLPFLLSDYHLVMLPSDGAGGVNWKDGIGCGPYKVEAHEAGLRTELTRHANYHRDGLAHFDGVSVVALNDPAARQNAILTNEVDAITNPNLQTIGLMERHPEMEIDNVASGACSTLPMFVDTAPFDNVDVRLAMKYAIDREEIVAKILQGYGSVGNDTPIGPTLPYYHDIPQRAYDPEKAKFHLKKAGMEGLEVSLSGSDAAFGGAVDMAVLYQQAAAKAGITINVVREPNDGYWSNVWLKKPFVVVQWGARPTPDVIFSLAYKDDAAWNESRWKNPRFNELLLLAKAELDDAKRTEMYAEMQQLCHDDGGTVVPFFRNRVAVRRKNLQHGPNIAGNWELDGARSYQRWWFES